MSAPQVEDQFLCSICLDVFSDPVSTPCGHNFCKNCITQHWDVNIPCECPLCKESYLTRPQLKVNTLLSQMVSQFWLEVQQKANRSSEQQVGKSGEVPCDICTGTRLKALKSCLVCLVSYCETHLEPHRTVSRLQKHQLIEPSENLEDRICTNHEKPLELFCKTDQTYLCTLCAVLDHKPHEIVPLKEEFETKKAELVKTEAETQRMLQTREMKLQEIKEAQKLNDETADQETALGVEIFTALKESVEKTLSDLVKEIKDKQNATKEQAEDLVKGLELEISDLKKKSSVMKLLLESEDRLDFLQKFSALKASPPTKDWTDAGVTVPSYEGAALRAVTQLQKTIMEMIEKFLTEAKLKEAKKFAVDVTLDPQTANAFLVLSSDRKQVYSGQRKVDAPDDPKRFSHIFAVLGEQSFSSGKFYFEVEVKGKQFWGLGVAEEFAERIGRISLNPDNDFWTICLRNGKKLKANESHPVDLNQSVPEKVGVFVDFDEGSVAFYDVDTPAPIYTFTNNYFFKLRPFLSPFPIYGFLNHEPLIICPVNQTA